MQIFNLNFDVEILLAFQLKSTKVSVPQYLILLQVSLFRFTPRVAINYILFNYIFCR